MAGIEKFTILVLGLLGAVVLICQWAGVWGHKQVCGLLESNNKTALPWMANIYQLNSDGSHEFICSGTVVSRKIIFTAARCFRDDVTKEIRNGLFAVSVGLSSKTWSSNEDSDVETRKISQDNIIIPSQYNGILDHYSTNIAIVKLEDEEKFNFEAAKQACLYWDNDFVESDLEVKSPPLKVAVWKEGRDSTFTVLEPLYINSEMCYSSVATDFEPYLTFDKMCVQIPSLPSVSSIGSGLYALNTSKNRWFLIGIASEVTSADSKTYITFIKIQPHLNWISNAVFLQVR